MTAAAENRLLQDGCGTKSTWRFHSLSAAVSFASSEDSSVALIGADSASSPCRRADFARLCLQFSCKTHETATCYENNAAL